MKRFSIFPICLLALLILAFATAGFGQDPPTQSGQHAYRHPGKKLKKMDANHDGQITRDEWKGKPKKFNKFDVNHDGVITKDELQAGRHKGQPSPQ